MISETSKGEYYRAVTVAVSSKCSDGLELMHV